MRQQLTTALLFLAVVGLTLGVFLGAVYVWGAIEQRNRVGQLAIQIMEQLQQQRAAPPLPAGETK